MNGFLLYDDSNCRGSFNSEIFLVLFITERLRIDVVARLVLSAPGVSGLVIMEGVCRAIDWKSAFLTAWLIPLVTAMIETRAAIGRSSIDRLRKDGILSGCRGDGNGFAGNLLVMERWCSEIVPPQSSSHELFRVVERNPALRTDPFSGYTGRTVFPETVTNSMRHSISLNVIRVLFVVITIYVGITLAMGESLDKAWIGGFCGLVFGVLIVLLDVALRNLSIRGFSTGTVGLLIGFLCAWLVTRMGITEAGWMQQFDFFTEIFNFAIFLAFGFIGVMLALRSKREEFSLLIPYVRFRQDSLQELPALLDSNVIIDGRIPAICATGFLGGVLVVPRFVLDELQTLADSPSEPKRLRGKRGLEALNQMQSSNQFEVVINEEDFPMEKTVDGKLTTLGKQLGARILTNDANLAKVARLQGVSVLNLNELSNALRSAVSTGDVLDLELVKEGKDDQQAVGYLPDGTMIVVNDGKKKLGSVQKVVIVSSVQTSAGRLIFAELK